MKNTLDWLALNSGLGEWLLLVVALLTAIFAVVQLWDSRELRFQQARPYVAVGLRRVDHGIVELYVRNLGQSAAHNVRLSSEPKLQSLSDSDAFMVFDVLPTLVPGDEWSTIWEVKAFERARPGDFSNRYEVEVSYEGDSGRGRRSLLDVYILDWEPHLKTTYIENRTIHDVAKALSSIESHLRPRRVFQVGSKGFSVVPNETNAHEKSGGGSWAAMRTFVLRLAGRGNR